MGNFLKKFKGLFIGRQSFSKRFATAFFPSLAFNFILLFFGPLDLSLIAKDYVNYSVVDIFPECLKLFGICFSVMFLVNWVLGGKLHVWISSLMCGLAAAFFIQGNFLNPDLGALDGTLVQWHNYGDNALIGLVYFVLIVFIPFMIHYFSRKIWKSFVILISVMLVVMQAVPLGIAYIKEINSDIASKEFYYMDMEQEYTLGKNNIVVFILDYTGPEELAKTMDVYPDILEPFHDFTKYENYHTFFVGTFPSATILLTHNAYDKTIPYTQWFEESWHSKDSMTFYSQMAENGWNTRYFNKYNLCAGTYQNEYGFVSNIKKEIIETNFVINKDAFRKLIKLSFYRYFPLIMKAPFWIYTGDIAGMKEYEYMENNPGNGNVWNDIASVEKFKKNGLKLDDEEKVYTLYHYKGSHMPYILNDKYERVEDSTIPEQLAGHFYIIQQYMQQMKDLGVYDSSTIIITSDHGNMRVPHAILFVKPAGQSLAEMKISNAPLTQLDYLPSIAKYAGLDYEMFGKAFDDISENEIIERCVELRFLDQNLPKTEGKSSNAVKRYCYEGGIDELLEKIELKQGEIIPLSFPYY